jgi:chromosome segregation ATPase
MKTLKNNLLLSCAFLITTASTSFAQEATSVTQTSAEIDDAQGNALRTVINRAEPKTIAKEWKSLIKDYDGDVDIKGEKILAKEVKIDAISGRGLTVYAKTKKLSESSQEFLVMFLNGDMAISSSNDVAGFTAANLIVKEFANRLSKEATANYNEKQISILGERKDEMEDLKKENEDTKEEIEDAKKEIEDSNEKIEELKEKIKDREYKLEENKKSQAEMGKKIEEQNSTVEKSKKEVELFN